MINNKEIITKNFNTLYPDFNTFETKIKTKVLEIIPNSNFIDDKKMFFKWAQIYGALKLRWGRKHSFFTDDETDEKLILALIQLLPELFVKTIRFNNNFINDLTKENLYSNVNKSYNENPDTNFLTSENIIDSTPGEDGNFQDYKNIFQKSKTNSKDKTIRKNEYSNIGASFDNVNFENFNGIINNFLNNEMLIKIFGTNSEKNKLIHVYELSIEDKKLIVDYINKNLPTSGGIDKNTLAKITANETKSNNNENKINANTLKITTNKNKSDDNENKINANKSDITSLKNTKLDVGKNTKIIAGDNIHVQKQVISGQDNVTIFGINNPYHSSMSFHDFFGNLPKYSGNNIWNNNYIQSIIDNGDINDDKLKRFFASLYITMVKNNVVKLYMNRMDANVKVFALLNLCKKSYYSVRDNYRVSFEIKGHPLNDTFTFPNNNGITTRNGVTISMLVKGDSKDKKLVYSMSSSNMVGGNLVNSNEYLFNKLNKNQSTGVAAGNNITITETTANGKKTYTINSTASGGGGGGNHTTITAGRNIDVRKVGDNYIISAAGKITTIYGFNALPNYIKSADVKGIGLLFQEIHSQMKYEQINILTTNINDLGNTKYGLTKHFYPQTILFTFDPNLENETTFLINDNDVIKFTLLTPVVGGSLPKMLIEIIDEKNFRKITLCLFANDKVSMIKDYTVKKVEIKQDKNTHLLTEINKNSGFISGEKIDYDGNLSGLNNRYFSENTDDVYDIKKLSTVISKKRINNSKFYIYYKVKDVGPIGGGYFIDSVVSLFGDYARNNGIGFNGNYLTKNNANFTYLYIEYTHSSKEIVFYLYSSDAKPNSSIYPITNGWKLTTKFETSWTVKSMIQENLSSQIDTIKNSTKSHFVLENFNVSKGNNVQTLANLIGGVSNNSPNKTQIKTDVMLEITQSGNASTFTKIQVLQAIAKSMILNKVNELFINDIVTSEILSSLKRDGNGLNSSNKQSFSAGLDFENWQDDWIKEIKLTQSLGHENSSNLVNVVEITQHKYLNKALIVNSTTTNCIIEYDTSFSIGTFKFIRTKVDNYGNYIFNTNLFGVIGKMNKLTTFKTGIDKNDYRQDLEILDYSKKFLDGSLNVVLAIDPEWKRPYIEKWDALYFKGLKTQSITKNNNYNALTQAWGYSSSRTLITSSNDFNFTKGVQFANTYNYDDSTKPYMSMGSISIQNTSGNNYNLSTFFTTTIPFENYSGRITKGGYSYKNINIDKIENGVVIYKSLTIIFPYFFNPTEIKLSK